MAQSRYHLAQVNVARMRAPPDTPTMADFVAKLDEINALADQSPGFVWRLQTPVGDATAVRLWDDDLIIVKMSVWENLELLRAYVYGSAHVEVMRRRKEWFERFTGSFLALWWVPRGHTPSVPEAAERLEHLRAFGPTSDVFTFAQPFSAPDQIGVPLQAPPVASCPA